MNIGYIAGFIDGEGCILITRGTVQIGVGQCHEGIMQKLKDLYGGYITINNPGRRLNNPNLKVCWYWRLSGQKAVDLLKECLPYLVVKKEQAEFAIDFHSAPDRLARKEEYKKELQAMKKAA